MGTFATLAEAQEYFTGDRFATESGMTIRALGEDFAETEMTLNEHHKNANGGVMGGAIFTLADFAGAVAGNNIHRPTVAQQVSCSFLSNSRGARLIATARCRKNGRTTCVFNIDVADDLGRDIAQAVVTGFKL